MRKFLYSPRLGRMTAAEQRNGRYMRAPDGHGDIDITADLVSGEPPVQANVPHNASADGQLVTPPGTVPAHGADVLQANAQPPKEAPKEPSIREQLSSAFKGSDDKPTDQQQAATADAKQAPVQLTQDKDGKWRTPDGTFASAEQVAAFQSAQQPQQPDNNQQQQQSPALQGLTPVEQQQFQSLPAELRQFVERTMEGLNTRAFRYGEYDQIEQHILGPRRQAFAQQGMSPVVALNQLFSLSDFAGRDPSNFVLWFAQQHNIDLDALLDKVEAANANTDPIVRQLQGQVQQLTGTISNFQASQQQAVHNANLEAVQQFANEKDETGNLKRPYITDVMDAWASQITAIRAMNPNMPNADVLEKAYQNACWADPNVRAKMQQANQEAARRQEQQRVEAARAAGASVTGAPAGGPNTHPNNSNLSLRDELKQAFASAGA